MSFSSPTRRRVSSPTGGFHGPCPNEPLILQGQAQQLLVGTLPRVPVLGFRGFCPANHTVLFLFLVGPETLSLWGWKSFFGGQEPFSLWGQKPFPFGAGNSFLLGLEILFWGPETLFLLGQETGMVQQQYLGSGSRRFHSKAPRHSRHPEPLSPWIRAQTSSRAGKSPFWGGKSPFWG